MSLDYMLLGSLDGRPIGARTGVLARARALGVDLEAGEVVLSGVRFEVALELEGGAVACVHLSRRGGGDPGPPLLVLAGVIGAVVFDCQSGRALGEAEPELPAQADGYVLELVAPDMGPLAPGVLDRLRAALGVEDGRAAGEGWALELEAAVSRVRVVTSWSTPTARRALFGRVVHAAEQTGCVPFDPRRNDTISGDGG